MGLVVRIPGFHCRGPGSVPGWGTEILQAAQPKKKKKKKFHILIFNLTFNKVRLLSVLSLIKELGLENLSSVKWIYYIYVHTYV